MKNGNENREWLVRLFNLARRYNAFDFYSRVKKGKQEFIGIVFDRVNDDDSLDRTLLNNDFL